MHIWNSAVKKAYNGKREIAWMEVFAGEKANAVYGKELWLPDETVEAIREYLVAIKGPLTTPVGGLYKQVKDPALIASLTGHTENSVSFTRYRAIDDDTKRDILKMIE